MRDPIDNAALELLRPLVAEIERAEAMVTKLDARDGPDGREVRIRWKVRAPEISAPEASSSETANREAGDDDDAEGEARPPCPTEGCDGPTARDEDDWRCRECGRLF